MKRVRDKRFKKILRLKKFLKKKFSKLTKTKRVRDKRFKKKIRLKKFQ
jgi:hypothetical protein